MNINIYLDDPLAKQLNIFIKSLKKTRNGIIREAIQLWISNHQSKPWPKSILNFKGDAKIPRFESTRHELVTTKEDPLE